MTAKLKSEEIWKCTIDWLANVKVDLFQYFCGFWSTRTLYYFPISVRPSITGVTCQLFSMIWWLRPRNHIFLNAYHQCWSLGWSEKPKSLKSKNGQADYLPRQNSFWNLDPTVCLLRNRPNAVYRKGYPFHKTKVKAFYRKEPQLYETKVDLTSRHTTELKKTTVKSDVILTFLQIWTNLIYIRTGNFNGKMTKK